MANIVNNIIASYKHIPYTIKHYMMVRKLQKQYIGYVKYKYHDLDKIFMYIFLPFLGTKKINKIHRKYAKHHLDRNKSNIRYDEAIIDWESARFTKPDKPMTAYETYLKYYPEYKNELMPYFKKFNLIKMILIELLTILLFLNIFFRNYYC